MVPLVSRVQPTGSGTIASPFELCVLNKSDLSIGVVPRFRIGRKNRFLYIVSVTNGNLDDNLSGLGKPNLPIVRGFAGGGSEHSEVGAGEGGADGSGHLAAVLVLDRELVLDLVRPDDEVDDILYKKE